MDGKPRLIRFICKRMGLILNFHDSSVCLLKNMSTRRFRKVNVVCCLTFWSYSESFILFLKRIKTKNVESWSETDRLTDGQKNPERRADRRTDGRRKIVRDQNIIYAGAVTYISRVPFIIHASCGEGDKCYI